MATRKKHIRTPYEDERKKHRAAASRHVLALEAQIKEDDKRKLFHIANDLRVYRKRRKTPCFSHGDIRRSETKFLLKG